MVQRARGREAERAGAHRFGRQHAHLRHLFRRRFLEPGRPLAHHEHAQRPVRQLGAEIHVTRPLLERVEILAKRFPRPGQPLVERGARDVLDAFHQLDQALAILDLHRCKADAAIAHHRRGDAMPARGLQARVPGRLAVIVGVDVDETRRDQQALGVDLLGAGTSDLTDAILPSLTATSASRVPVPVPSATVPPRTTRSKSAMCHSRVCRSVLRYQAPATPHAHSSPFRWGGARSYGAEGSALASLDHRFRMPDDPSGPSGPLPI